MRLFTEHFIALRFFFFFFFVFIISGAKYWESMDWAHFAFCCITNEEVKKWAAGIGYSMALVLGMELDII